VPGYSLAFLLKQRLAGLTMFLASTVCAVAAVVMYRNPISDLLFYGVLALSMVSVVAAVDVLRKGSERGERRAYFSPQRGFWSSLFIWEAMWR